MLIQIKSWLTDKVIYEDLYGSLSQAVVDAVRVKADLSGANLSGANLSRANLSGADLSRANLSGADLSRANLSDSHLSGSNLSRADLSGADLSGSNLSGSYLSGSNLSRANLSGADLSGSNLSRADLSGADLSRADLSDSNLDSKYCFLSISPIGSEKGCLWVMRNEVGVLMYNRGCFSGTEEQFVTAVKVKHAGTEYERKYLTAVEFIKSQVGGA